MISNQSQSKSNYSTSSPRLNLSLISFASNGRHSVSVPASERCYMYAPSRCFGCFGYKFAGATRLFHLSTIIRRSVEGDYPRVFSQWTVDYALQFRRVHCA